MRNLKLNDLLGERRGAVSFHDSEITKIHLDYLKREAIFEFLLCAEDVEDKNWHSGRLNFNGLLFFISEIPDENYSYDEDALDITSNGSVFEVDYPWPQFLTDLPDTAFIHFFYVNNWNRRLFIAATDARFEWNGCCP